MAPEKVVWSAAAAKSLARALGNDLLEIEGQVKTGICELWQYTDGGYCVTRVEVSKTGTELVIVASGVESGAEKLAGWVNLAKNNGWSVRIHSQRPGMKQFLNKAGFVTAETVYRWQYGR
ncbi:MAG: STAS domain-containing protein [Marinospirillum sp.]|uniref:STAS domain-containing protein n=1 Tax=Marinospirillum sp. TaxID=2183934 RepID=UPI001A0B6192|nr:STAS domain-containing protein [Marinospirillum sp.]MBE0507786.1 STAS domain-containing protein [Marinospirillum sp.]